MPSRAESQDLFNFGPRPQVQFRRPDRLFFACFPDRSSAGHIHRLGQRLLGELDLEGRSLSPDRLHVSLHHVGDFSCLPAAILRVAGRAASAVRMHRFDITFHSIRSFGAPRSRAVPARARPLVLLGEGNGPLELHRLLGAAMRDHALRPSPQIVPHMTLAYASADVRAREIDPIRIPFDAFSLVHSERGRTRYNLVGRWLLDTSQAGLDLNLA